MGTSVARLQQFPSGKIICRLLFSSFLIMNRTKIGKIKILIIYNIVTGNFN